jgi:hypothetical protein
MGRLFGADLDFVSDYAHLKRVDSKPRIVGPFAVANAEPPGVPGTSHNALLIQIAAAERSAHVRTQIVDRVILAVVEKHRNEPIAELKRPALSIWDVTDFGDRYKIVRGVGHDRRRKDFLSGWLGQRPSIVVRINDPAIWGVAPATSEHHAAMGQALPSGGGTL